MSQTARKGKLKGKPHIRKAEEEKKEWISHNKRRKGQCGTQWRARKPEKKMEEAQ